jgi:hypothetical protein
MPRVSRRRLAGPGLALSVWALAACYCGSALGQSPGAAGETGPPKCKTAEVNPVTGHVFCINPLGAPVEPPPAVELPCKPDQRTDEAWTWGPKCKASESGS